ncbi:MAG: hypothetical protein JO206_12555, partial [Solirubrobacterales bacterium]|nr:hypothetical protein [Solirubrobacterales bacterium]
MRRRPFGLLVGLAATAISVLGLGAVAGPAAAQPVLVLTPGIGARLHDDPFLTGPAVTPAPPPAIATAARAANKRRPPRTPISELGRLYRAHALTRAAYRYYNGVWSAALAAQRRLQGTRADELGAVIANVRAIAAAGLLTPSRLPALLQTVLRNRQWWSGGPLLSSGDRVEFSGSQLVWEYYPGQGIELQVLGSFGKADGLFTGGPAYYPRLAGLLAELIPLAAR